MLFSDIYKKTGAWFYKGLPNYDIPNRLNGDAPCDSREQPPKVTKTTKLGMEIESDEDDEESARDEQKIIKNGSFGSNFLKSRNLFNLRLSTDAGSKFTFDTSISPLPKKSPISPYSRQTSSSDSQKSANSLQPPLDLDNGTPNGVAHRQRRNSISSCYSINEGSSSANETFTMNQSEWNNVEAYDNVK